MFESIPSANPSKNAPTEWLLARIAGRDRATAILGDLTEMAATRGRVWFWTAYARTLISLGWRTPAAFFIAMASVRGMVFVYPRYVQHMLRHLHSEGQVSMFFGQLAVASGPLLNAIAMCLWFALPYAWIRFGLRDPLTRFAWVLFFCTLPVFSFQMWLIDLSSIATMIGLLAALLSPQWRKPLAVLALTFITTIAAVVTCHRILAAIDQQRFLTFSPTKGIGWLTTTFALAIAAFVCSLLQRWLLRPRPTIAWID